MRLATALEIYQNEGPNITTSQEQTARALATKVVHLHVNDTERSELVQSWRSIEESGSKGLFFAKLEEVKTRLRSLGFI